jgi:hypothetical protein
MLPGCPGNTTRAERNRRNSPARSQRPRCVFLQRNLVRSSRLGLSRPTVRGINISGVDFWHAVEFSRNGRFLRNRFTGFSGRFPSVFPTLPDPFSGPFPVRIPFPAPCWSGVFRAFRRGHYVSGFPPRLIIEPPDRIPGTPKSIPMRGRAVVVCRRCGASGCPRTATAL